MSSTNHWLDESCARAFWDQHKAAPYQELLRDTVRWLHPKPGERWLDLGCGAGHLSAALWQKGEGQLQQIVAMDCAAVNELAIARLRNKLQPTAAAHQLHFVLGNLSEGLPRFVDGSFDGIVSGLAISYAESRNPHTGVYDDTAYNRILREIFRVLKPGGTLVFSVNVPEPNFMRVFWKSLGKGMRLRQPHKALWNAVQMLRYGRWLCREAKQGRFHYLSIDAIDTRLRKAGYEQRKFRLSYADQAYIIAAHKPGAARPYGPPHIHVAENARVRSTP